MYLCFLVYTSDFFPPHTAVETMKKNPFILNALDINSRLYEQSSKIFKTIDAHTFTHCTDIFVRYKKRELRNNTWQSFPIKHFHAQSSGKSYLMHGRWNVAISIIKFLYDWHEKALHSRFLRLLLFKAVTSDAFFGHDSFTLEFFFHNSLHFAVKNGSLLNQSVYISI